MELRRLRYFVAVADELHFGRAADRLHMAQPPLSQQIRRLEAELGATLFTRSTRRVALTEAGRLLYPQAQRLLAQAGAVERSMAEHRAGTGGVLRIGFVDSASYEIMPRLLRALRRTWPGVRFELHTSSSDSQHAALVAGELDIGIVRTTTQDPRVQSEVIHRERLVVAVSSGHDLARRLTTTLARLRSETFVGFARTASPSLHRELADLMAGAGVAYDPVIEAEEYTTILGLVAAGEGVAVVPEVVSAFRPPELTYLRLRDRVATTRLLMLHRSDEQGPLIQRALEVARGLATTPAATNVAASSGPRPSPPPG